MTTIINLTPHPITLRIAGGDTVFPVSGTVARVAATFEECGDIAGFPVRTQTFGEVSGLPEQTDGVYLIVSGMVLSALKGTRDDVVAPDTGPSAIRNDKGHIVAATGFVK